MSWKGEEHDHFWYPSLETPPPPNFTPGLIPVLKTALMESHEKGNTRRAVLCFDQTVHITKEGWDRKWGCGYRNFEMVCTALMVQSIQPVYFALLDGPTPPSVRNLQTWIEDAWKEGFDPEGRQQLKQLVNTNKQIGTSDLWVAFSSRRIPAELVEFNLKTSPKVIPPGYRLITDWVIEYFSSPRERNHTTVDDALRGASPVTCTDRMPFILQYSGHSLTIVGYEISKTGTVNLLSFNSCDLPHHKLRNLGRARFTKLAQEPRSSSSIGLQDWINSVVPSNSKKRSVNYPPAETKDYRTKRIRSDKVGTKDEVIIISDSSDTEKPQKIIQSHKEDVVNGAGVLRSFRLDPKKLWKRNLYQILYFPLEDMLDDRQRLSRKEVISTQVS